MTTELPPQDAVTAPWWDGTREHRLLVQACSICGRQQHPPRAVCLTCGAGDTLTWQDGGTLATIDACTVVERSADPTRTTPYVVARVRLACGVVLLSNVLTDLPDELAPGDRVQLAWHDREDGRALPVFTPHGSERKA